MKRETKFVVEGLQPLMPIQDVSLGEVIYQNLLTNNTNIPALINGHTRESLSYSTLLEETCTLGEALRKSGYGINTVITISSKNSFEFLITTVSSLYIGATLVPINHNYTLRELQHCLGISKPKVILCSKDVLEKYIEMKETLNFIEKIIVIDSDKSTPQAECLNDFIRRNNPLRVSRILTTMVDVKDHVATILSSSGTTGFPKGVMLTDRNWNTEIMVLSDPRFHAARSRMICVQPFFHGYGFSILLSGLTSKSTTIFFNKFEVHTYLKSIQDFKVTKLLLLPSMVIALAKTEIGKYDVSSVTEILSGAAPLAKETEEEFKKRFNTNVIRQAYGLTETVSGLVLTENDPTKFKPGSSGRVVPYSRICIRDLENRSLLGPHQIGEICVKSTLVMKGYCGNPEATKNSFDEDGWLLTGDVGYYDEDEYIFITGRIKELIKYNGYQVAPAELEAFLLTHPGIIDCAVIGVPDRLAGELPLAFVVKLDQYKLTQEEVQDFVKSQLSPQKWLRGGVIFVDTIPKNATGKIARKELHSLLKKVKAKL